MGAEAVRSPGKTQATAWVLETKYRGGRRKPDGSCQGCWKGSREVCADPILLLKAASLWYSTCLILLSEVKSIFPWCQQCVEDPLLHLLPLDQHWLSMVLLSHAEGLFRRRTTKDSFLYSMPETLGTQFPCLPKTQSKKPTYFTDYP